MERDCLNIAQCLCDHPLIEEKNSCKVKYLNVLEYFTKSYAGDDIFAKSMLKIYKEKLLGGAEYTYNDKEIKKAFKGATRYKLKGFKLFTYRYHLLFDCLFTSAFNDEKKAKEIITTIKKIFNPHYGKKLDIIYKSLYNNDSAENIPYLAQQIKRWKENKAFMEKRLNKILITANMSAGKSTLINALIGKKINRTQNDACTAKVHYIFNKPYEDELSYEWDYDLELDADLQTLMEDNVNNTSEDICVGTYFRSKSSSERRLCLIDTPGVNSSVDISHKKLGEKIIKSESYDMLVYVLNAENIGTDDDRRHLQFVLENYRGRIVFVVNKVDKFRKNDDSVPKTLQTVVNELKDIGFKEPYVVPVSSYAAYLAKKCVFKETIDEDEQDELDRMTRKLKKTEYQFDTYFPDDVQRSVHIDSDDDNYRLLFHSGILHLESIIFNLR